MHSVNCQQRLVVAETDMVQYARAGEGLTSERYGLDGTCTGAPPALVDYPKAGNACSNTEEVLDSVEVENIVGSIEASPDAIREQMGARVFPLWALLSRLGGASIMANGSQKYQLSEKSCQCRDVVLHAIHINACLPCRGYMQYRPGVWVAICWQNTLRLVLRALPYEEEHWSRERLCEPWRLPRSSRLICTKGQI